MRAICSICASCPEVRPPLQMPDPNNPYKLLLQGPKMGLVAPKIRRLIEEKFPDYSETVISEREPPSRTSSGLPIYTKFLVGEKPVIPFFLKRQTCVDPQRDYWETERHHATCGVFATAKCLSGTKPYYTTYALTAGHSILTPTQCKEMVETNSYMKRRKIWKGVVGEVLTEQRLSIAPFKHPPFSIVGIPLVNLKQYTRITKDLKEKLWHEQFMSDDAAFQMDQGELNVRRCKTDLFQKHVIYTPVPHARPLQIPIGGIIKIKDQNHLRKLINVKVFCGGVSGVIRQHPTTLLPNKSDGENSACPMRLAHHIAFDVEGPQP